MSELETQLRRLAANGELTYLSIIPVVGKGRDGGNTVFAAQVSPASRFGHSEGRDPDPVAAILKAIEGLPKSFVKPEKDRRVNGDAKEPPYDGFGTVEKEPWDT